MQQKKHNQVKGGKQEREKEMIEAKTGGHCDKLHVHSVRWLTCQG